ncbi:MAG TPA: ABC transporter permease [Actinophytocola sp.]|uniref:ABC transporter permease n=1 Tax=Actinophytocola sp. TaxID=1872138 RepID=UPI002DBFB970|nr:ABC transporter permease [Actinophytocola sp.]HEU5475930.1 ABC transporter permease [Actinophytocola sp.]
MADSATAVATAAQDEERISVASQRQLIWWRFRKHKLAMVGAIVVLLFYLVALFADFLSTSDPHASEGQRSLMPPQQVHWFDGGFSPHVYAVRGERDPITLQRTYVVDPTQKIPVTLFAKGYEYEFLGLFTTDIHLIGTEGARAEDTLFLFGTDQQGRDIFSRLIHATRTSMLIGLAGVALSILLGVVLGGISGYYGGAADTVIQRTIEILRSIPTIPLWMGLAAAMPKDWSVNQVYFALTLILSVIGWTELGRVVRGRMMQIRSEDFVTAAELVGGRPRRIIFKHMVPLFASHIIAATTLALPLMIVAETSLSFLGLGLRPPAISWGVMLQQAQNVQAVALYPWMLLPVLPVVAVILAFNFLGDGLRDAADPYDL